ncbi:MAG: hypothetical protein PHI16_01920 [Methanocellales archaeon]|nr:hypothetical protein [Methanocellales archaeon]
MTATGNGSQTRVEVEKTKLEQDIEVAKRAEKALLDRRKKAPIDVKSARVYVSPRDVLVRRLFPEALPTPLTKGRRRIEGEFNAGARIRVIFTPPDMHERNLAQGWIPAMEDGLHVNDRGDLMYYRDIALTRDEKSATFEINKRRLAMQAKKDMDGIDADAISENVLEVSKG